MATAVLGAFNSKRGGFQCAYDMRLFGGSMPLVKMLLAGLLYLGRAALAWLLYACCGIVAGERGSL